MGKVYCEFCGKVANNKVRSPEGLVGAVHNLYKNVIRCNDHRRTSKMSKNCRSYDPFTGDYIGGEK